MDAPITEPSSSSLQDKIAQLEAELKSKNTVSFRRLPSPTTNLLIFFSS